MYTLRSRPSQSTHTIYTPAGEWNMTKTSRDENHRFDIETMIEIMHLGCWCHLRSAYRKKVAIDWKKLTEKKMKLLIRLKRSNGVVSE